MSQLAKKSGILLLSAATGIILVFLFTRAPAPVTTTPPTSQPAATVPIAIEPSTQPKTITTYLQLLHADLPNYPDALPFDTPVDITDAAHIILKEPVYVCPRGDLWITRPDADPLAAVLKRATDETEHIVGQSPQYILWTIDRKGDWQAQAVCRRGPDFVLISATDEKIFPRHRRYDWSSAFNFDDNGTTRLIVPADEGVSAITIDKQLTESYVALRDSTGIAQSSTPQILRDLRGFLAWIPPDGADTDHGCVARFIDGDWEKLDGATWPSDIIQLVPMLDGTVLQIRRGGDDQTVQLDLVALDKPDIDEKQIANLVQQLGDDDPDKRTAAYAQITQYGPGVFPILEKFQSDAPPEAQARIAELLEGKLANNLGGMIVNDNLLTVTARLSDGGIVFFAPHGVSIPQGQQAQKVINPDYLAIRPGRVPQSLPEAIVHEMDNTKSIAAIRDEWVITRSDKGPQRYLPPDQFVPLLRESDRNFSSLIAIDGRSRWLFRKPQIDSPTLILDPNIPDATPRLALWLIDTGKEVGWTKDNWPVVARGNDRWVLTDHDWQLMPASGVMLTDASSWLVDSVAKTNRLHLPPEYAGADDFKPWLATCPDGHLLLMNSPGRIIRLRSMPDGGGFEVEAVFDRNILFLRDIRRFWTDPAGRIAVAYSQNHLAIIFPTGQVPPADADQILPHNLLRLESP